MQRERLEGWMVKQIENADLAKATVIQLPTRTLSTYTQSGTRAPPTSPRRSFASPRRRPITSLFSVSAEAGEDDSFAASGAASLNPRTASASTSVSPVVALKPPPQSPRARNASFVSSGRKNSIPLHAISTSHPALEADASTGLETQWRSHFHDSTQGFVESGRVDRTKVLRHDGHHQQHSYANDKQQQEEATAAVALTTSPLFLWGLPREHIVEYIRQSVLPSSWSMSTKYTGEWEAVASDAERDALAHDALAKALASLPPLSSSQQKATLKEPTGDASSRWSRGHTRGSQPAARTSSSSKRPQTSPFQSSTNCSNSSASAPTSPRITSPRSDDRINRILNDLRADPSLWEAFEKSKASDKILENKQRVTSPRLAPTLEEKYASLGAHPRALTLLDMQPLTKPASRVSWTHTLTCLLFLLVRTRKKQAEERMARTKRQREHLVHNEEARLEARLVKNQQRFITSQQKKQQPPLTDEELARSVGFRRRRIWLVTISFLAVTTNWHANFQRMQQVALLAKQQQAKAAQTIQALWRNWQRRQRSTHSVVVYTWLRKCMWRLLFTIRCRRKARLASTVQRFMLDHFSGSHETRNFNRMMLTWRRKVIHSQRVAKSFVLCTRARFHTLSLFWDRIDHERHRSERLLHERAAVLPTDEKDRFAKRASQRLSISGTVSLHGAAGGGGSTVPASGNTASSSLRKSNGTLLQLETMNEKLTSMQQVLTPIELQRLQQHAFHVVRISKSVKLQLLREYLTSVRKEYTKRLTQYTEQSLCASYAREVHLDDARAIVQNSVSWGTLQVDRRQNDTSAWRRPPLFELFAGEHSRRRMEELVRKGVQLTLERDAEQRFVVERQQQQRLALHSSAALVHQLSSSSKRRESGGSGSAGGDAGSVVLGLKNRQSTRRLGFMLPFKESIPTPAASSDVAEDNAME